MPRYIAGDYNENKVTVSVTLNDYDLDLIVAKGFFNKKVIPLREDLKSAEIITKDNYPKLYEKHIGDLVDKNNYLVRCQLHKGRKFILEVDEEGYKHLQRAVHSRFNKAKTLEALFETEEDPVHEQNAYLFEALVKLKKSGIISDEEFETKKAELLGKM
ncbi:SHOCT domain-containing protein [Selenomonadales bacterium OttesenSCG-928-I06]|nr:SHOCT domain-containing protein [Selenomonadales bacterium OttesenSCG-928-I06]